MEIILGVVVPLAAIYGGVILLAAWWEGTRTGRLIMFIPLAIGGWCVGMLVPDPGQVGLPVAIGTIGVAAAWWMAGTRERSWRRNLQGIKRRQHGA